MIGLLQHDINREAAKISSLSSGKTDKYDYLTDKEILPSNQRQTTEETKLHILLQIKLFEKQIGKQVRATKSLDLSKKNELTKIKGIFPQHLMSDLKSLNCKILLKMMT